MTNYQESKIYEIVCKITGDRYVGSTTKKYLCQRLAIHRCKYKRYKDGKEHFVSVYTILERGDYSINLLERYPCQNKKELYERERFYIEAKPCINQLKPIRTREDNKASSKKYYDKHHQKCLDYAKQYREQKYHCECGSIVGINHKQRHLKTSKHQNFFSKK